MHPEMESFACKLQRRRDEFMTTRSGLLQSSDTAILLQSHVKLDFILTHQDITENPKQSWELLHNLVQK